MPMDNRQTEVLARLSAGITLNVPLYFLARQLALWSSAERELRLDLIAGSIAAATVVVVAPVVWRGAAWQAPIALVLIVFLPGLVLFSVIASILQNW